jgi:outer membrane receptor for ferrienterochelin and colicins
MHSSRLLVAAALVAVASARVAAAESVDDALATETDVAHGWARPIRETPGIVTVLERDEILASGARDLADLLARIPGFQLGADVENTVGAGFRGIWGQEGKILFLVDGIEMNDLSYGGFPLGNHVLAEGLERVEVVRGPGSALYGGHAELAVVNVVTRAGAVHGAGASFTAGRLERATSAASVGASAGGTVGGLRVGAVATLGTGVRSDRDYVDLAGARADMASASRLAPAQAVARLSWKGVDVRALYDDYRVTTRDGYGDVMDRRVDVRWRTAALDARWAWRPTDDLTVTPQLVYRWEQPWQARDPQVEDLYYDVTNERVTARVVALWDALLSATVLAGGEASVERGRVNDFSNGLLSYGDGDRSVTTRTVAAFAELGADTDLANVLAGARVEKHSEFGTSFVPRFALTRRFDPFHLKVIASGAFRTPSIENVNYGDGVRPERTVAYEAEAGWQISEALYAVVNAFDVTIERPIVYGFDGDDAYTNGDGTGSRGVEAQLELRRGPFAATGSYSFYTARGENRVPSFAVPGDPSLLVGFAGHKVVGSFTARPLRNLLFTHTITYLSERHAYDGETKAGDPTLGRIGARTYVDLFAAWQNVGTPGLELGVGIRDALDQGMVFVQPYPGGHPPLPGGGREVMFRMRYETAR